MLVEPAFAVNVFCEADGEIRYQWEEAHDTLRLHIMFLKPTNFARLFCFAGKTRL